MKLPALFFLPYDSGLGNQLFISAAAKAYRANSLRTVVLVADRALSQVRHGWLEDVIDLREIKIWKGLSATFFSRLVNFLCRRPNSQGKIFQWSEPGGIAEEEQFLASQALIFRGYFQTSRFPNPVYLHDKLNIQDFPEELDPAVDVAIHVRRGDYLIPENEKKYGTVSLERLLDQGNDMLTSTGGRLVIFSDSPRLVKLELSKFAKPHIRSRIVFISDYFAELSPVDELRLMSRFLHVVISNSTFSLWAARLGPPNKKVIAPWPWLKGSCQPANIIPSEWQTAYLFD